MSVNSNPSKNAVPFLDLVTPHHQLQAELTTVLQKALSTAGFIGGPVVEDFEKAFANFCDTQHCVGVASGTDALRFAFMAAGIQPGDVIITVPHTFIATTEAISQVGAHIAFVDVDKQTYTMDPRKLEEFLETQCERNSDNKLITKNGKHPVTAIVPVHLYGHPADMDAILELSERFSLIVIEDACQAHGADYFSRKDDRWKKAGSMGHAAAFSFYPGKNLGACGEAGAVTTNDAQLAKKIRMIRDHGQARKYYHDMEGYNGRLDAIQAGFLRVKLNHLEDWNEQRREHAQAYHALLDQAPGIVVPQEASWGRSVYHLYVVQVADREGLMAYLNTQNIGTGIHYPIPLHLQNAYLHLGYKEGDFPVTERVAKQIVSLPMFPQMTSTQRERVAHEVRAFLAAHASKAGKTGEFALIS
jgi:dTDP-4-amino-4,6-dideoxygalactose transaminase